MWWRMLEDIKVLADAAMAFVVAGSWWMAGLPWTNIAAAMASAWYAYRFIEWAWRRIQEIATWARLRNRPWWHP